MVRANSVISKFCRQFFFFLVVLGILAACVLSENGYLELNAEASATEDVNTVDELTQIRNRINTFWIKLLDTPYHERTYGVFEGEYYAIERDIERLRMEADSWILNQFSEELLHLWTSNMEYHASHDILSDSYIISQRRIYLSKLNNERIESTIDRPPSVIERERMPAEEEVARQEREMAERERIRAREEAARQEREMPQPEMREREREMIERERMPAEEEVARQEREMAEREMREQEREMMPTETAEVVDPFAAIERALEKLEFGNLAFNAPKSMNLHDTALIQLFLGLDRQIDELKQMIKSEGEKEGASIRVCDRMEARRSGSTFAITAITPEEQAVSRSEVTEWKWEVKPTSVGSQRLHLTLTALISYGETTTRKAIRTFDKLIEVEVTWNQRIGSFLETNWQWLWTVLLIPIVSWLWKRRKGVKAETSRSDN
jgi:hypothetical protein